MNGGGQSLTERGLKLLGKGRKVRGWHKGKTGSTCGQGKQNSISE